MNRSSLCDAGAHSRQFRSTHTNEYIGAQRIVAVEMHIAGGN